MSICYGHHIYLEEVTENVQIILSVIDSGTGMAEKYLSASSLIRIPYSKAFGKRRGIKFVNC